MTTRTALSSLVATLSLLSVSFAADPAESDEVDFNRDVRSLLASRCFTCHGPDAEQREAGLRLDTRRGALAQLEESIAVVPGKPDESSLIERIESDDEDLRMPPADSGKPLTAAEQGLMRRWVTQGAVYQEHWAFVAPVKAPLPDVSNTQWPRGPLYHFVLAQLDRLGLKPAPEASRRTIIRRLALALTGLPPTPEEVQRFVEDDSTGAHEAIIDHYLDSSAFGERWTAVWLDLARYADSAGYAQDPVRTIWPYRDWVISAINENMSFEQFTIEQIAGDMLPNPTQAQLIATGFHRNTMTNSEGGTDDEEFRNAALVDRTNTTMQVWMGITMGCVQCHEHKYDPLENEEYYRVFAMLNQTEDSDKGDERPTIPIVTEEIRQKQANLKKRIAELEKQIAEKTAKQEDGKLLPLTGPLNPRFVRIELPGQQRILSIAEVQIYAAGENVASMGKATQSSTGYDAPAKLAIDGDTDGDFFKARSTTHNATAEANPWWELDLGSELPVERIAVFNRTDNGLFSRMTDARVVLLNAKRRAISVLALPNPPQASAELTPPADASKLTAGQQQALSSYGKRNIVLDDKDAQQLASLKKQLAAVKPYTTPIMRELPPDKRRVTNVQIRGNWLNHGPEVTPGVPALFHPLPPGAEPNRLALARWLVDRKNPLTARVIVNRFWDQLFGQGLVTTAEEFGTQGTPPTHPKLLDHLAVEFMEHNWDVKWLLKRIVGSATYCQSARASTQLIERDPANKLLARGPRFRLSAEMIRDQALAVSGLISDKMYGPPVNPPRPKLGLRSAFGGLTDWTTSPGEDRFRRALYTNWRRTTPYPSMTTFDAPSREFCAIRRIQTNTPLQALVTLNDPVYIEAAQGLARRVLREGGDSQQSRVTFAVELCLGRPPQDAETIALTRLYQQTHERLQETPEDAKSLAAEPIGPPEEGQDVTELAAWTVVSNVLLNLDEFLMRP